MKTIVDKMLERPRSGDLVYSARDFKPGVDVRWCAGCGAISVLSPSQKLMPELGVPKEKIVYVSGIGCSGRFPYYMDTYGFHSIHGRALAIASGLKIARPEHLGGDRGWRQHEHRRKSFHSHLQKKCRHQYHDVQQ